MTVPDLTTGRRPALTAGVLAAVLVALLAALLGACSGGGDDDGDRAPSSASRGSETDEAATVTSVTDVAGGPLGTQRRQRTEKQVTAVVDDYLEGAFLGAFPRSDWSAAFADFSPQAATLARKQLGVVTNQAVSDSITSATATNRRLRLSVFAPSGRPRGVTARFVLDFTTAGTTQQDERVLGQLYLTKPLGKSWQVFGFHVDQAVTR